MALSPRPERAFIYRLGQYLTATIHGRGSVELRRGGDRSMSLTDVEARKLAEAIEHFRAESLSPAGSGSIDRAPE